MREKYGVDDVDASAKHVDSGRVAVVYSSDASATFRETWSGTSKERRRSILQDMEALERELAEEHATRGGNARRFKVKTIFIETCLTKDELVEEVLSNAWRETRERRGSRG